MGVFPTLGMCAFVELDPPTNNVVTATEVEPLMTKSLKPFDATFDFRVTYPLVDEIG